MENLTSSLQIQKDPVLLAQISVLPGIQVIHLMRHYPPQTLDLLLPTLLLYYHLAFRLILSHSDFSQPSSFFKLYCFSLFLSLSSTPSSHYFPHLCRILPTLPTLLHSNGASGSNNHTTTYWGCRRKCKRVARLASSKEEVGL